MQGRLPGVIETRIGVAKRLGLEQSGQCGFNITPTIENAQDCYRVGLDTECDYHAAFKT
jgi:hypothetical protein